MLEQQLPAAPARRQDVGVGVPAAERHQAPAAGRDRQGERGARRGRLRQLVLTRQDDTRGGVEDLGQKPTDGFDLILMDVQMPELYGDDVANVLRNVRAVRTPIYLFSTLPDEELQERVADARVDGFISKGRGAEHLVAEVRKILGT